MSVTTEGGTYIKGVFFPNPAPIYRYVGDPARITSCSYRGKHTQPRVCWDGSCPGYIDRRCAFCGEALDQDLADLFIPVQRFIITLIQGTAEELNKSFIKTPGMTVIEVTEDTFDFLYNSLIEKATSEKRLEAGS